MAPETLIDSIVDEVVSAVRSVLSCQKNFNNKRHCILANISSWFSNYFDILVLSWEIFWKHVLNLRSYNIEIVLFFLRAHREATSNIKEIHIWHTFLLCHFKYSLGIHDRFFVRLETAATWANMEGNASDSKIKLRTFIEDVWPVIFMSTEFLAHWIWSISIVNSDSENQLSLRVNFGNIFSFFNGIKCHQLNSYISCEF